MVSIITEECVGDDYRDSRCDRCVVCIGCSQVGIDG